MELLCVLAAVAALFCGCAVLTLKCRVPASVAPLTALSAIVAVLTLAAMAGVLYPAAWLLYLLCLAGGVWVAASCRGSTGAAQRLFTPGSVLFWGMALAFTVYFFVRQPMATDFDELSLWATAVKITKVNDSLYATAKLGTPWAATQNPGLPLLAYFFQFFGDYSDWKIYVGYDILYFSVFAAVVGAVPREKWRVAVPMAAVLWCVPFFFTNYNHTIYLTTTYMTSYGDVPAGLVFGGAVAAWLALRQNSAPKWAVLPILALSANIKANTFVLALVAAGLVAVDEWLFADDGDFKASLLPRTGFSVACFAAPMAIYYLWNVRYVGWLVSRSASDSGVGETSAPLSAVVVNGIKILLGQPVEGFYAEREAQFRTAMADMGHQFWTSDGKLSMIGQGRNVVALIAIVFVVAILAAASRRLKARIAVIGALSGVCFLGYNLMLALSYGFIFVPFQAEQLVDYNRYIYSYYIGWFILALGCLSAALLPQITVKGGADGPTAVFTAVRRQPQAVFELFVLTLACGMLFRQSQLILPQLSVLGFADSEFTDRRAERAEAELVCSYLAPDDRVFYVGQGDNGEGWFSAVFDFYPILVDYSGTVTTDPDTGETKMIGGGGELGQQWYEDGKFLCKKNTFNDYLDVCDALLAQGYGDPRLCYGMGGSAGGMLMGVAVNERPELFHGVIAQVPFVDVVTTMLDETIPLTTGEFEEWGNPQDETYYHYMKSYSPYDGVRAQAYPHMLVTTGLHDSQVQYWEPAKWVAKLRELKTDDNLLLLCTDMDSGHGGKSGRFKSYEGVALEYAFFIALAQGTLPGKAAV